MSSRRFAKGASVVAALLVAFAHAVAADARCEDPTRVDAVEEEGGIGGTGRSGGIGGTGRSGGIGGTGRQDDIGGTGLEGDEAAKIGGTAVLGTLRGETALCVAGVELKTGDTTAIVASDGVSAASLRAGDLVLAVGHFDAGALYAERVDILGAAESTPRSRTLPSSLRRLVVESEHVVSVDDTTLRAAGIEFRADRDLVRRSRSATAAPQRIHARRGAAGEFRATRLEILDTRPTRERPLRREPQRPEPQPAPAPGVLERPAPPPRIDHPPARPIPDRPMRPERPLRPERPELPPRPDFERLQPLGP